MGRVVILVVAMVAAAYALVSTVWEPYRCNVDKRYYDAQTVSAVEQSSGPYGVAFAAARRNIAGLRRMTRQCPTDLDVPMLLAQNHLILEQRGDAIASYERALRISRRPEIYQLLGEAQAATGRRREAIESLLMAQRSDPFYRNTEAQRHVLELELRGSPAP